jgi:hypothetical protein
VGRGDVGCFPCKLGRLLSGSYGKHHVSCPVIIDKKLFVN